MTDRNNPVHSLARIFIALTAIACIALAMLAVSRMMGH